jgi:hypothetical protein
MHQMQIDIKQGRLTGGLKDNVRIPNFVKKRLRRHQNEILPPMIDILI